MRCILVYGLESSGTSCVAGILHLLGVHMGDKLRGASETNLKGYFEDVTFFHRLDDFCSRDRWEKSAREWIQSRLNQNQQIWGLKCSLLKIIGEKILRVFKQYFPDIEIKIIYVTRDVANIVKSQARKRLTGKKLTEEEYEKEFKRIQCNVISSQIKLANLIEKLKLKYKIMTIDYDFVISQTTKAIRQLGDFCFMGGYEVLVKKEGIKQAMEFVEPGMRRFA